MKKKKLFFLEYIILYEEIWHQIDINKLFSKLVPYVTEGKEWTIL